MSISSDGELWYGIIFEEGEEQEIFGEDVDLYDLFEKEGFDIINYCSGDYAMWGLAIKDSHLSCSRGYPKKVLSLPTNVNWDLKLQEFMQKYKFKKEIGWWLTSYMG